MQYHAKGSHVTKLNPDWIWPPSARAGAEEGPPPVVLPDLPLINSFPVEKQNDIQSYGIQPTGTTRGGYQAFTALVGGKAHSAWVSLRSKSDALEGNVVVSLHTASGSAPGLGPMFPPIAVSDPLDVKAITMEPEGSLYEFLFSGANQLDLVQGETYCISVTKDDRGAFAAEVPIGYKFGAPSGGHDGNGGYVTVTSWGPDSISDMIFYLYTLEAISPPLESEAPTIEDCWGIEHKNDDGSYGFYGRQIAISMSFKAKRGGILDRAKVWMKRSEPLTLPPNTFTAHIYETSKPIASATPEGASLAASESVDGSTFAPMLGDPVCEPVEFFFTGANQIQLVKDKVYCLVLQRAPLPLPEITYDAYRVGFAHRIQPPMAEGNYSHQTEDGVYSASFAYFDMIFYVHSLP